MLANSGFGLENNPGIPLLDDDTKIQFYKHDFVLIMIDTNNQLSDCWNARVMSYIFHDDKG